MSITAANITWIKETPFSETIHNLDGTTTTRKGYYVNSMAYYCGPDDRVFQAEVEKAIANGVAVETVETAQDVKNRLNVYATQKRNSTERSGLVHITLNGVAVPFHADFDNLLRIGGASRAAGRAARKGLAFSKQWPDANGVIQTLTGADLEALDDALVEKVDKAHTVYAQVLSDIGAGLVTTETGIDGYDWPA